MGLHWGYRALTLQGPMSRLTVGGQTNSGVLRDGLALELGPWLFRGAYNKMLQRGPDQFRSACTVKVAV